MRGDRFSKAKGLVSLIAISMMGCSNNFMPITDEHFLLLGDVPSGLGTSIFKAVVCSADGSACGKRKTNPDLYDEDILRDEYNGSLYEFVFEPAGGQTDTIVLGYMGYAIAPLEEGGYRDFYLNDYPRIRVDTPPVFEISSPAPNIQVSRSLQSEGIRIEWSPSHYDFPMSWKLLPIDNELEERPCDKLSWGRFEGEGEDTGVSIIPLDVIPEDLPPQGCEVSFSLARTKKFDLPAGIEHGRIENNVLDGVIFKIVP